MFLAMAVQIGRSPKESDQSIREKLDHEDNEDLCPNYRVYSLDRLEVLASSLRAISHGNATLPPV